MRILPVQYNNYNSSQPSFKSFNRSVFGANKGLLYCNDTWFFRSGGFWNELLNFLKDNFRDVTKANVYCYGCSDGSEVLSFIMKVLADEDKNLAHKFLPVIAKDRDQEVIKKAKSKDYFYIKNRERDDIDYYGGGRFNEYFSIIDKTHDGCFAYASPKLYENVKFSVANIEKDCSNIQPNNSVVFVRNFWPYIRSAKKRQNILDKLSNQLKDNSYIIIGDYDMHGTFGAIEDEIIRAGFQKTEIDYVYKKVKIDNVNNSNEKQCRPKDFFKTYFNV